MNKWLTGLLMFAVCSTVATASAATRTVPPAAPRVFLLEAAHLLATRQAIRHGDTNFAEALAALERDAKEALKSGPWSVVSKEATPPSGDKHDFMSLAPYFWRNPATTNGLPYIRRDGERNPETRKIPDRQNLGRMIDAVETLALAYYFKGDEACATQAALLLRTWFLDPATRMNPHLQYGQAVPGVNTGRGIGLIETAGLTSTVDAIGLLAESKAWTAADQRGMEAWFTQFLAWMLESKNGRDEAAAKNNHGTYYDVQIASFALFLDKQELASNILQTARQKRIATQIEPDGRQPLELARTKAWSYSIMNLQGLMSLAKLGEHVGVDLWQYRTPDGRAIIQALDFLTPFALGEQKWPYRQLGEWSPNGLFPAVRLAATKYPDPPHQGLATKIPEIDRANRQRLVRPQVVAQKRA